ncbi:MAG: hypothetical protein WBM24_13425 [Candidatus Sulfotelmatobacter sp.]
MTEPERRALVSELAEAVSTQAKVANRAWLALITAAVFAVLPRTEDPKSGNLSLPWNIGEVDPRWFHAIAFFILVVLAITFASAHAQQIRAQVLTQGVISSLAKVQHPDEVVHPRELYDMLRTPSLNRVAPLAQLLRGKYQFYASSGRCPQWLRVLSVLYYGIVKLVSLVVFYLLPIWALGWAYMLVALPGIWRMAVIASARVAGVTLLQVLYTDVRYTVPVLHHLWGEGRPLGQK